MSEKDQCGGKLCAEQASRYRRLYCDAATGHLYDTSSETLPYDVDASKLICFEMGKSRNYDVEKQTECKGLTPEEKAHVLHAYIRCYHDDDRLSLMEEEGRKRLYAKRDRGLFSTANARRLRR